MQRHIRLTVQINSADLFIFDIVNLTVSLCFCFQCSILTNCAFVLLGLGIKTHLAQDKEKIFSPFLLQQEMWLQISGRHTFLNFGLLSPRRWPVNVWLAIRKAGHVHVKCISYIPSNHQRDVKRTK